MASKTGIANTALRRLGISQKIVDVETDESTEATTIKDAYDEARDNVLGDFDWSFAGPGEVRQMGKNSFQVEGVWQRQSVRQ